MQSHKNLPLLCALIVNAAVLSLGVDIWFRNEAGSHLLWLQNHPGFWEALKYPGMIQHYRPVSFLMLSVIYHLFGTAALPYVLANFVGFLLTLIFYHTLIRYRAGHTVAFFSLIALFPLFSHVLYYPFNAVHGIFYSWDVAWFCLGLYFFMRSMEGNRHRITYGILTVFLALIALGTHGFSGLTLAVVMCAYIVFRFKNLARHPWLISVAIAIPVFCFLLIPLLEPMGGQVLKTGAPLFPHMAVRFTLIAHILMFPKLAPILIGGIVQTTVHYYAGKGSTSPLWGIAAAIVALALFLLIPVGMAQVILLIVLGVLIVLIAWRVADFRAFALMGLLGFFHYFLIRGESSNYLRFLIFGITPIVAFGILNIGGGVLRVLKRPLPTERLLPAWATVLTLVTVFGIGLGLKDVPGFRVAVQKIRYLCYLSQNFHDVIFEGTAFLPKGSRILIYFGDTMTDDSFSKAQTQAQDIATMYTRAHLYKLRPAKPFEYPAYFSLAGRADLRFKYIERGVTLSPGETVYVVAFNIYEVLRTRTKFSTARLLYYVHRGRAEAAIFQITAPLSRTSLQTPRSL